MNLPISVKHVMVLTGEPSGDLHAGKLIEHLKAICPGLYVSAIGGKHLEKHGADIFFPISRLSAMGVTEVLFQFRQIKEAFMRFKKIVSQNRPDLIILVDYPGFNLKAAEWAKSKYPITVLYYIPPKVWAWKKSRLKKIKTVVDHAALIFPFERKIYRRAKIKATYVGNPLLDEYPFHVSKQFLPDKKSVKKSMTIGLLPGSRKAEIKNLLGLMAYSAQLITTALPKVKFLVSKAESVPDRQLDELLQPFQGKARFKIISGPVKQIFMQSDLLIAASGTVTLEAALCCIPTILIYKMSGISYRIARLMVHLDYAGLANIIAGKEVMPELLQHDATPEMISKKALEMAGHLDHYQKKLQIVRQLLGSSGAARRAAAIAADMING